MPKYDHTDSELAAVHISQSFGTSRLGNVYRHMVDGHDLPKNVTMREYDSRMMAKIYAGHSHRHFVVATEPLEIFVDIHEYIKRMKSKRTDYA